MKQRYFIPLVLISAFVMMLLFIVLLGVTVSWSFEFLRPEYAKTNLTIMRLFAVAAALAVGVLALPLGFVARQSSSLWGFLLPILGLMLIVNPWNDQAATMLSSAIPEYSGYILSCWCFWNLGDAIRRRQGRPQPPAAPYVANRAGGAP